MLACGADEAQIEGEVMDAADLETEELFSADEMVEICESVAVIDFG